MSIKRDGSEISKEENEGEKTTTVDVYSRINTMYIDRFLAATTVAPKLIQMRIFPNVKEITESMAAYAHTSKHILSRFHDSPAQGDVKDAILCVGDGSTPRSAALFALFFPNWECYSIDPQLQEGYIKTHANEIKKLKHNTEEMRQERRAMWEAVPNLHIVGDYIQKVRIRCRHLVVVMIHCHLSFQQVMSSVECEDIVGVLTLPCCNFFEIQQQFMGRMPTMEFQDPGIWSDKNTVRLWIKPELQWIDDYHPLPGDVAVLPLPIPTTHRLINAEELRVSELEKKVEVAGEIIAIRRFGKKLTFLFVNTSNIYYNVAENSYAYYETNAYDNNNQCKNACVIVLKLQYFEDRVEEYGRLFEMVKKMKNRAVIKADGKVVKSKTDNNIVEIQNMIVLASNKQATDAQRLIAGINADYLNIDCKNERNINFVNADQ